MRGSRRRLTFANVVSVIALVLALGGTAAASVIITSNGQVAKNTISGHHPPSGDHANLIGGSLARQDLALSAGRTYSRRAAIANSVTGTPKTVLTLPGFGEVQGSCFNHNGTVEADANFRNTSTTALDVVQLTSEFGGTTQSDRVLSPNQTTFAAMLGTDSDGRPGGDEFVIGTGTGSASRLARVIVTGLAGSSCVFQAQGTEQVG
jgi:hypothetical protein